VLCIAHATKKLKVVVLQLITAKTLHSKKCNKKAESGCAAIDHSKNVALLSLQQKS
jgi:hypothetical protein